MNCHEYLLSWPSGPGSVQVRVLLKERHATHHSQVTLRSSLKSGRHATSFGRIVGEIYRTRQPPILMSRRRDVSGSTLKVSTFLCMVSWLMHAEHLQLSLGSNHR